MFIRDMVVVVAAMLLAAAARAQPSYVQLAVTPSTVANGGQFVGWHDATAAHRYDRAAGIVATLPGSLGVPPRISADGAMAACAITNATAGNGLSMSAQIQALWSAASNATTNLGTVEGGAGCLAGGEIINTPLGVSADGRHVVGLAFLAPCGPAAFTAYWTDAQSGVSVGLGHSGGGSRANAISDDGNVVVGWDRTAELVQRPSVWRRDPGSGVFSRHIVDDQPEGLNDATLNAVNADGSVVVGAPRADRLTLARFVWNGASYVRENLGAFSGAPPGVPPTAVFTGYRATGISADGSVIVGTYSYFDFPLSTFTRGFIWTSELGLRDLGTHLAGLGISGAPANANYPVSAISRDGRAIVGGGPQSLSGAFLVTLDPTPCAPIAESRAFNTQVTSRCDSLIIMNVAVSGTGPFSYAWFRDGVALADGPTGWGSTVFGAQGPQMFVTGAGDADGGAYTCVVSNPCSSFTTPPRVVTHLPAASNDLCAGAAPVTALGSLQASFCGAYVDEGVAPCAAETNSDQWFRFTAPADGSYRFTTCGSVASTVLTVLDDCGGAVLACSQGLCGSQAQIQRLAMTSGQSAVIRLALRGTLPSDALVTLRFEMAPAAPANDACAGAVAIGEGAISFDTSEATADGSATCVSASSGSPDLWFAYTPTAAGRATLSTCGSSFATTLSVHPSCGAEAIACGGPALVAGCFFQSRIDDLPVSAGVPLLIRVAGAAENAVGAGVLAISLRPACNLDYNGDGVANPDDVSDFVSDFFADPPLPGPGGFAVGPCQGLPPPYDTVGLKGDFNNDCEVNVDDISDFVTAFFGGC